MNVVIKILLCVMILFAACASFGADEKAILSFGDSLYEEGDYYRAITEYKRIKFMNKDSDNSAIRHRIAMSYFRGEKYETAQNILRDISINASNEEIRKQCKRLLAACYYEAQDFDMAINTLQDIEDASLVKIGWCQLMADNPEDAIDTFSQVKAAAKKKPVADKLKKDVRRYTELPKKSPALAGMLSAAIPGAGQVYNGKYRDGLTSFILNGLFIWGTIEAFDNDENVAGTFSAVIATGWYSGNIYNAVSGAHKINRDSKKKFLHKLDMTYGISIADDDDMKLMPMFGVKTKF